MQKADGIVFIKKDSERLPGKNLRSFNGVPLYRVILQTLQQHPMIENILVDSDSEQVLDYIKRYIKKAVPIPRPDNLLGGHISANQLIKHDISFSGNNHFFQTHCTNPLLTPATIDSALKKYFGSLPAHDSLFSVIRIQNRFFDAKGGPVNHLKGEVLRLQDLAPVYMENASFFIFSASSFAAANNDRIGLTPQVYPISPIEGTDIDYEDDFLLAELLHSNRHVFPHVFGSPQAK